MTPPNSKPNEHAVAGCALCATPGGVLLWSDQRLRLVRIDDTPDFPAFYRVIWNRHVAELSDLDAVDLHHCMDRVAVVERCLRQRLAPTKMNLASLGNMVPHLHWHLIARFDWDTHFPQAIWAAPQRSADTVQLQRLRASLSDVDRALAAALAGG